MSEGGIVNVCPLRPNVSAVKSSGCPWEFIGGSAPNPRAAIWGYCHQRFFFFQIIFVLRGV